MNAHIIAVDTYGAQRVTAPQTGKTVSAYKIGYTTAVTAVLLALYGENARDVRPNRHRIATSRSTMTLWCGMVTSCSRSQRAN